MPDREQSINNPELQPDGYDIKSHQVFSPLMLPGCALIVGTVVLAGAVAVAFTIDQSQKISEGIDPEHVFPLSQSDLPDGVSNDLKSYEFKVGLKSGSGQVVWCYTNLAPKIEGPLTTLTNAVCPEAQGKNSHYNEARKSFGVRGVYNGVLPLPTGSVDVVAQGKTN